MIIIENKTFHNKGITLKEDTLIKNCIFEDIIIHSKEYEDGICIIGPNIKIRIEDCIFVQSNVNQLNTDEAISLIKSPHVEIYNTQFINWGKTILAGNGDFASEDKDIYLHLENCTFNGCSRRNPYVRYGKLIMKNCLIKNWGKNFHTKSYGVRLGDNCNAYIENCTFHMDKFIQSTYKNFFIDWINQINGDMWGLDPENCKWYIPKLIINIIKHPLDTLKMILPGPCKGVYTENKASVQLKNCKKNKWWIFLENNK